MENENDTKAVDEQEYQTEIDPLNQTSNEKEKKNFKEKFKNFFKNITVEPVIALFLSSGFLISLIDQNFVIEKTCRSTLNYTDDICTALRQQKLEPGNDYEASVQKISASLSATRTIFSTTVPSLIMLFAGSWTDRTGNRKIMIIIPIIGQILCCSSGVLNYVYFYEISTLTYVLTSSMIEGFSGGWAIIVVTTYSHLSAITSNTNRTFRLGLFTFCITASFSVGMGLSGVMLKNLSFKSCYSIIALFHILNLLYVVFLFKDTVKSPKQKEHNGKGFLHFIKTFFDLTNVRDTLKVVFKKGPNKRRLRMCVLMAIVSILFGPMHGEISIMYLSTRFRFNWDELQFSLFQTYNFVTHTAGTMFSILVFSKHLKCHDSVLGIISTLSKLAASFIYCFAPNDTIFFIGPIVEILSGTAFLSMRAITSKLVATDELGKLNSIFGLTENLMPLIYVPLYTKVYTSTMEFLPGFVFLMGAMMTLPAIAVFFWLFYEHRKNLKETKRDEKLQNLN